MKKIFFVAITLLFVFVSVFVVKQTQTKRVNANATSGYAQIVSNDCFLFSSPNFEETSKIFLLEESYFVKVVSEENNLFYKVKYIDFDGFVPKSKIKFVEEYPEMPYLSGITFDIYDIANVCLRTSPQTPDDDKNVLCTIEKATKNLLYYGKISGEEAMTGLGNIWYFCAYQDQNQNVFKGYIYAPLTRNLSSITGSQESLTYVNITNFVPIESLLYLNLSTKNLLIVITAIPSIVAVILLVYPTKPKNIS